jgi:hypothetical protein
MVLHFVSQDDHELMPAKPTNFKFDPSEPDPANDFCRGSGDRSTGPRASELAPAQVGQSLT